jgi:hypothetical protein
MRVFCKEFAKFYKYKSIINQPRATHRIAVLSYHACVFVKSLQTFTNTKASSINQPIATHRTAVLSPMQSTESPILFRSHGHETPFSDQNGASKIGDSVLCSNACVFVKSLQTFTNTKVYRLQIQKHAVSTMSSLFNSD